jgi:hypothetical protein
MGDLAAALDGLEDEARARVLRWAAERFGVTLAGRKPGSGGSDPGRESDGGGGDPDAEYEELGDLFSAASPTTPEDRALVVAYWLQELQNNSNVTGQQVNTELKNFGHGEDNITRVFTALVATRPQLMIQTKKSGTSRQARKSFKVTRAGTTRVKALIAGTAQPLET